MVLNGLFGADVPLRNYSLTHSLSRAAAGTRVVNYPGNFLLPDGHPGNRIFNLAARNGS